MQPEKEASKNQSAAFSPRVVRVEEQEEKVLRKLERRRELPQELVRGVQKLGEDRGSLADPLPPVPAARGKPMAEGAPVFRHENLAGTIDGKKSSGSAARARAGGELCLFLVPQARPNQGGGFHERYPNSHRRLFRQPQKRRRRRNSSSKNET